MTLAHRVAVMDKGVVQQIAAPREVYENPANLFVAGFIGSPPMNTLPGSIADGAFRSTEGSVPVSGHPPRDNAILGFRPEDASVVAPDKGHLRGSVFACELTGHETIVTCRLGGQQVVVKMGKSFDLPLDAPVGISVDSGKACLFDEASGGRLRPEGS
jgi:multiple sugar transport system ATP-binding protein